MIEEVEFVLNGEAVAVAAEPRMLLTDLIRDVCGLTGTHAGCEHGSCGACTVWLDGVPVRACLVYAPQVRGRAVTTIEGIGDPDGEEDLTPLQAALRDAHGLQCGFCTPGIVMTMTAWLAENPRPNAAEVREALSGNLCRCTGYGGIVEAVLAAAGRREAA